MARHVDRPRLHQRTVVQFDFRDPKQRYLDGARAPEVSVCLQHPGSTIDLGVSVDTGTLYALPGTGRGWAARFEPAG